MAPPPAFSAQAFPPSLAAATFKSVIGEAAHVSVFVFAPDLSTYTARKASASKWTMPWTVAVTEHAYGSISIVNRNQVRSSLTSGGFFSLRVICLDRAKRSSMPDSRFSVRFVTG